MPSAATGNFSEADTYMIDVEAWIRMLELGRLSYVPESLCTFRVSSSSWSSHLAREQAREVRSLVRRIRAAHVAEISRFDLAMGLCKTTVLALIRRGAFWLANVLAGRGTTTTKPNSGRTTGTGERAESPEGTGSVAEVRERLGP